MTSRSPRSADDTGPGPECLTRRTTTRSLSRTISIFAAIAIIFLSGMNGLGDVCRLRGPVTDAIGAGPGSCAVHQRLRGSGRRGYGGVHDVPAGGVLAYGVGCRSVAEELISLASAAAEIGLSCRAAVAGFGQPRGAAEAGEGWRFGPDAREWRVADVGRVQVADDRRGRARQDGAVG